MTSFIAIKKMSWGEAFFKHMKLGEVTHPQDKEFCNRLKAADEDKAKQMVRSRILKDEGKNGK